MKSFNIISKIFVGCIFGVFVASCSDGPTENNSYVIEMSRAESNINDGLNDFGIDLFKAKVQTTSPNTNFIISPVSSSLTLSMLANAVDAQSQQQIFNLFGVDEIDDLNSLSSKLIKYFGNNYSAQTLKLANAIWHQEGNNPIRKFSETMMQCYSATVTPLNFNDASVACNAINSWGLAQSDGLINRTVDPAKLNSTMLFLASSVFFKADWAFEFNPSQTTDETFNGVDRDVEVKMMNVSEKLKYCWAEDWEAVTLPYNNDWEMTVILPVPEKSINDLLADLTDADFKRIYENTTEYGVRLAMPKFKVSDLSETTDALKSLGVDFENVLLQAFEGEGIDSSIVFSDASGIEVDEKGTTAAVVSTANGMLTSPGEFVEGIAYVTLDHPFIYLIRNVSTGSVLMAGQIVQL